jgi:DNA-binding response OmpR family regulator
MLAPVRLRILYVDGDVDSRSMITKLLGLSNIETVTVPNASRALSMIQTEQFDLYLLEAWLPGVDGFELCRQMRYRDPSTPIVFFSAAGYEIDKKRAFHAGASKYFTKPDIDGLLRSVAQYVPQTSSAAQYVLQTCAAAA